MSSQVELEKLYDKHDKTQMELRQTHTNLDKYKEETATLEAEVDRFAGRMGKYQVISGPGRSQGLLYKQPRH